jgi:hypothetical protein
MFMKDGLDTTAPERAPTAFLQLASLRTAVSQLETEMPTWILVAVEAMAKGAITGHDATTRLDKNRRIG